MHSETTQRVTANLGEADSTESGRNQQRPLEEEKALLTESQEEGSGSGYTWAQEESHTVRAGSPEDKHHKLVPHPKQASEYSKPTRLLRLA